MTKRTYMLLALIVSVLVLGIAYAAIQNVTLSVAGNVTATPDQGNFKVEFLGKPSLGYDNDKGVLVNSGYSKQLAWFNVTGLKSVGDMASVTIPIRNYSTDIAALVSATVNNSNTEYFEISTYEIYTNNMTSGKTDVLVWASGDNSNGIGICELTIVIKLIKSPVETDVTTKVTATITAVPTYS